MRLRFGAGFSAREQRSEKDSNEKFAQAIHLIPSKVIEYIVTSSRARRSTFQFVSEEKSTCPFVAVRSYKVCWVAHC